MDSSYLSQQISTIITQLHGLFDDIGVPSHERESRESDLFSALSETLHNQLRLVSSEKNDLVDQSKRLIRTIRQMEASLDDTKKRNDYEVEDEDMRVSFPLLHCLQDLKEKHNTVSKLHRERFEQVKKLVEALESYASHLEPSFIKIKLPKPSADGSIVPTFDLSPTYVNSLDTEFTRVYEEYNRRISTVKAFADDMITLWAELGTPQAQTDSNIVACARDAPEQLGLHQDDLSRLRSRRDKLVEEKRMREKKLKELKIAVEELWERLGVEDRDRKAFLSANRGCGLRTINEFEDELSRLNELKKQNLHLFVEDARYKLQELWDSLYFSEEEMLDFTPAFSDVYSDALLSAHEAEISRLEALREQRAPTLQMIDKHRTLVKDRDDLQASSQDASRLMARGNKGEKRDPTRLLREEKMRKRIAKELPKLEADLIKVLEQWEDEYGRPFLVHGHRYLDELAAATTNIKPVPPRSKTPNCPPPAKSAKSASASTQRGGTLRGAPPPRSKTPTAQLGRSQSAFSHSVMSNSSNLGNSISAASAARVSPSKIPARAPLSNMPHGNNSPERRARPGPASTKENDNGYGTIRGRMGPPPPRAPPPKMKDLFVPPTPEPDTTPAEACRSASIVRHVDPEDVYDDRDHYQNHYPPQSQPPRSHASSSASSTRPPYYTGSSYSSQAGASSSSVAGAAAYGTGAGSRQISATSLSSAGQAAAESGSENWETYDDASEAGDWEGQQDTYRARMRMVGLPGQQQQGLGMKRGWPEERGYGGGGGEEGMGKRVRGLGIGDARAREQEVLREGSEAGWTDESGF
ncbi:MAG: hypothetical protein M1821_000202 [Bathelium mastoideum]|nr:MAG: hypothetical protein M1821_000202 [Bathelium mastoideum]